MPFLVLVGLVVGGIGSIVVALHLLGLSTRKKFADAAEAGAVWQSEFPDDPARNIMLSDDHHAAVIGTSGGQHGIVWPMGADATARYLGGATIRETPTGLSIRLPDVTVSRISLRLGADEAAKWAKTGDGRR